MANDRLFIQCDICGDRLLLYKYSPGGGYAVATKESLEFIESHLAEHEFYGADLEGHPFTLQTEATVRNLIRQH